MSKYQQWYDSLPEHTKTYLKRQPLWHDRDLYKAFAFGTIFGTIIGLCI